MNRLLQRFVVGYLENPVTINYNTARILSFNSSRDRLQWMSFALEPPLGDIGSDMLKGILGYSRRLPVQ